MGDPDPGVEVSYDPIRPHVLGCKSTRVCSAQRVEIDGMEPTVGLGLRVSRLVEKLAGEAAQLDNAATLDACTKEDFFEDGVRTRHFALRTGWMRDQCYARQVHIRYRPGVELVSDALMGVLGKQKF